MNEFIYKDIKIEFLSESIIHLEKNKDGQFSKGNSFFAFDRDTLKRSNFEKKEKDGKIFVYFGNVYLTLEKDADINKAKFFDRKGNFLFTYERKLNTGELPKPYMTPYIFPLFDNPRIYLPKDGYSEKSFLNKKKLVVQEDVDDVYLLVCEKDPLKLRKLYISLTGKTSFVRFKTLGVWHSRYYKYNEESAKEMINLHDRYNLPLDNMVIDTDWRKANDIGIGYEIDTKLFPNMKRFLSYAHSKDVDIMFNDHPEPVKEALNCFDEKEVLFREKNLQYLLSLGLDYWRYDRNWSTKLIPFSENISAETCGAYLFTDITKNYYKSISKDKEIYRRPLIMCNVDNVINGSYISIFNSASHRYSIQWDGDIVSPLDSLRQEVANLIKLNSNEITYFSSDLGGHIGNPSKYDYIRRIQFGTFEPIFRVHCTNNVKKYREPWNYDEETVEISRNYVNLRYRLLPLLYSKSFDNYQTGEPLFKDLAFNYSDKNSINNEESYIFANDLLISPFCAQSKKMCENDGYLGKIKVSYFDNPDLKGEPIVIKYLDKIDMFLIKEPPCEKMPIHEWSARFEFKLKFKENTNLMVVSDDGCSVFVDGKKIHEDKTLHSMLPAILGEYEANKTYNIVIEYYQHGGEAGIYLRKTNKNALDKKVALPNDTWIDLFNGKIYSNGKVVHKDYSNIYEMPLFIRAGSLIPLVKEENRALKLDYSKLTLDYYPSLTNSDKQTLYEDDKETTAFKFGNFRTTEFTSNYDKNSNSFKINISKANGEFKDNIKEREIIFKYNLFNGLDTVKEVLLNGKPIKFGIFQKDESLMPLSFGERSRCYNTLVIKFKEKIDEECQIEVKLN